MNGTMRVLAVGDLAPECIARLEEDGLRVDARPEWGEAELRGRRGRLPGARRRAGRAGHRRRAGGGARPQVVGGAGADVGRHRRRRGDAARRRSSCTRPDSRRSSPRPSTRWPSCWPSPATWPAPTPRSRRGDAGPAAGRRRRGPRQDARARRRAPELGAARRARARAGHDRARVRAAEPGRSPPASVECVAPEQVLTQADVLVVQTPAEAVRCSAPPSWRSSDTAPGW